MKRFEEGGEPLRVGDAIVHAGDQHILDEHAPPPGRPPEERGAQSIAQHRGRIPRSRHEFLTQLLVRGVQ